MLRPLSLLPALVVVAAATWGVAAPADAQEAPRKRAVVVEETPLAVTIDTMSPASVPRQGRITVTGTITNRDDVAWTSINAYAFVSPDPMTTRAELTEAAVSDPTAQIGERITTESNYAMVGDLAPGQSKSYTVRVRAEELEADASGVYWFGIHALGDAVGSAPDTSFTADGRARTFLPRMTGSSVQLKTALVVPLRTGISYDDDGSIADPESWTESLSSGRLDSAIDLGVAAGSRPLTWLVDPAVLDATTRLAAGNPGRVLGATLDPDATEDPDAAALEPTDAPDPDAADSAGPADPLPSTLETQAPDDAGEGEEPATEPEKPTPAEAAAARAAQTWLGRLDAALSSSELLALPYGDLDAAAAAAHDDTAYADARQRSAGTLDPYGSDTGAALGGPTGFLDAETIAMAAADDVLVGSDRMLPSRSGETPTLVSVGGKRVVLASSAAASGGPGPDDRLAPVALRQRILAEAAVRRMAKRREPLVVVLPAGWDPVDATELFRGLDQEWIDLVTLDDVRSSPATAVAPDKLVYPGVQRRRQLDSLDFGSAATLTQTGSTLQYLLTRNDTVGREVADQAFTGLSYSHRLDSAVVRAVNDRSQDLLEQQLRGVTITGPPAVTLTSDRGTFGATLENTLDEPVTVRVRAVADEPISISMAEEDVEMPPHTRRRVLLTASTQRQGMHNVTLQVTDINGTALGAGDEIPVRAAQVSAVIWVIIGTGAALLFGAIGVRLFRRARAARRTPSAEEGAEAAERQTAPV